MANCKLFKKIRFYNMHDSACMWLIVKNAKIFRGYIKHVLNLLT